MGDVDCARGFGAGGCDGDGEGDEGIRVGFVRYGELIEDVSDGSSEEF